MRVTVVGILLAAGTAAASNHHAVAPRPTPGHVTGGKLVHVSYVALDEHRARYSLELGTSSYDATEVSLPIAIPTGQSVTTMRLALGRLHTVAHLAFADAARREYTGVVDQMRDPALLEQTDAHHVVLHVYPISRGANAVVTIELADGDESFHVDAESSLVAIPYLFDDPDPYGDYWPSHRD
jgi:hypothetical protein